MELTVIKYIQTSFSLVDSINLVFNDKLALLTKLAIMKKFGSWRAF